MKKIITNNNFASILFKIDEYVAAHWSCKFKKPFCNAFQSCRGDALAASAITAPP